VKKKYDKEKCLSDELEKWTQLHNELTEEDIKMLKRALSSNPKYIWGDYSKFTATEQQSIFIDLKVSF